MKFYPPIPSLHNTIPEDLLFHPHQPDVVCETPAFAAAAALLQEELTRLTGPGCDAINAGTIRLGEKTKPEFTPAWAPAVPAVTLLPCETLSSIVIRQDTVLAEEEYGLKISADEAVLTASTLYGINHAAAMLLQLGVTAESESAAEAPLFFLPDLEIREKPDKEYRGVMLDMARSFMPLPFVLHMVDACRLYGIRVLHLHFSDDQSYTLPSRIFPDLPTPGRHYTFEEIEKLGEYAYVRGVELMPELETPGHCTKLQQAYPDVFGSSGIISLSEHAQEGAKALLRETAELFPHAKRIHIGGDEAVLERWYKDPASVDYMKEHQMNDIHQAYAHFVAQMSDYVLSLGRIPVVWEGFPPEWNHLLDRRTQVFAWESYYQLATDLLASGFEVINASWEPMYLDFPDTYWSERDISRWSVYTWMHWWPKSLIFHNDLQVPPTEQVIGGQLCAWGGYAEVYGDKEFELSEKGRMILERMPILSEKTWHADSPAGGLAKRPGLLSRRRAAAILADIQAKDLRCIGNPDMIYL